MRNITISKFGVGMFVAGGAAGPGSPARKEAVLRRDARPRRRD